MFCIRADANATIGAGHIMRCLSIAEALKEMGEVIVFLVADEESAYLVRRRGFAYLCLNSKWNDLEEELPELLRLISESNMKGILIDNYCVTDNYMRSLHQATKIFYLDDLGEKIYQADTLINYNIYAPNIDYENLYAQKVLAVPNLLIGCKYAPVRREFWSVEYSIQKNVKNVLISTGGGDSHNIAGKLLQKIQQSNELVIRGMNFHVVSGAYNPHITELRKLEKSNSSFHVYENVTKMADLMQKCDVAISAYGSTVYELTALGIPTIGFYFVDNQKKIAESFGRELTHNVGNIVENENDVLENILIKVEQFSYFYEERCKMNEKMTTLLDGSGARRIAEALRKRQKEEK